MTNLNDKSKSDEHDIKFEDTTTSDNIDSGIFKNVPFNHSNEEEIKFEEISDQNFNTIMKNFTETTGSENDVQAENLDYKSNNSQEEKNENKSVILGDNFDPEEEINDNESVTLSDNFDPENFGTNIFNNNNNNTEALVPDNMYTVDEMIEKIRQKLIYEEYDIGGVLENENNVLRRHFKFLLTDGKVINVACEYNIEFKNKIMKIKCEEEGDKLEDTYFSMHDMVQLEKMQIE